jgi:hypothetical protein
MAPWRRRAGSLLPVATESCLAFGLSQELFILNQPLEMLRVGCRTTASTADPGRPLPKYILAPSLRGGAEILKDQHLGVGRHLDGTGVVAGMFPVQCSHAGMDMVQSQRPKSDAFQLQNTPLDGDGGR